MKHTTRMLSIALILIMLPWSVLAASTAGPTTQDQAWDSSSLTGVVAPDGSIWAAWVIDTGVDREIVTNRWNGKSWAPTQVAVPNPGRWDSMPTLAFDARGVAWLAWSSSTGTDDTLHVSHWTARGWSTPQEVPAQETIPNRQPVLAAAPEGGLWLAWVGFDGNDDEIYAAFWDGSTWSRPQRVSSNDTDPAAYDAHPRLAVAPDGTAWVAWTSHQQFLDTEIFTARWNGQRWTPEEQVSSSDGTVAVDPSLAAGDGTIWLAWQDRPADEITEQRIYARQWTQPEGWGTETLVSSAPESPSAARLPSLVLDDNGRPHVTWHVADGNLGIGYAVFDGTDWSPGQWLVQDTVAETKNLSVDGQPVLLWWPADASGTSPRISPVRELELEPLPVLDSPTRSLESTSIVIDRHVAFGDSITWGQYVDPGTGLPVGDYPARLEAMLDSRVTASEVINQGSPGEKAYRGKWRLRDASLPTYQPEFVEIMEGTNDISDNREYDDIALDLTLMIIYTRESGSFPLLSTLIPRRDDKNDETSDMNGWIASVAAKRNVPLVDNWQAFYDYGDWRALYIDILHPDTEGMALLANSWYEGLLAHTRLLEDNTPPTAWMTSWPAQSQCPIVPLAWTGDDGTGSGIASFDLQVQDNGGFWNNWLVETPDQSGTYANAKAGHTMGFHVRARDKLGNVGGFSSTVQTFIVDNVSPDTVSVVSLPSAQKAPFVVSWSGTDACDPQLTFDVEYCVGATCTPTSGGWNAWLTSTSSTSGLFSPPAPQYGERYYFRARGRDDSGNSKVSALVSTRLAQFTVDGELNTIRHEPVALGTVTAAGALAVDMFFGGAFRAYVAGAGAYDLSASSGKFGTLPPRYAVQVQGTDVTGLDFVLPPLDDVVQDGGFESGTLTAWLPGGTSPAFVDGHTGYEAVRLGGEEGTSSLSQALNLPPTLTDATLSFMVKLDGTSSNSIQIELEGTPFNQPVPISPGDWTHVWLDVGDSVGQEVTLVFTVSGSPAVILDEVSLGSAASGGGWRFMPIIARGATP